ncbi:MAG: retropepsin-like aspartic protease, partial [Chloroflexi bacterium]|nr:retropepsin-like aspartic protease [Chloroflexota bacterium]
AQVAIPALGVADMVEFLVDTGADATILAPADAFALGVDVIHLPNAGATRGVGGATPTATVEATLTLDSVILPLTLRILAPRTRTQQRALASIPSLLGRDVLSQFALVF